jgi:rare lipoprotein A (peptidoglycan hydrolase)
VLRAFTHSMVVALAVAMPTHRKRPRVWTGPVLASWYDDAGVTASGTHYARGFAALIFGSEWGRAVSFCVARGRGCAGAPVTGRLDDHGPYVSGRTFDLDAALKAALHCSDLCSVRYRVT